MSKPVATKPTKARVNEIIAGQRPIDYPDSVLTGFMVRCHPTGKKVYYYRYRINGTGKFLSLGTTAELSVTEARDLASDAATLVRRGICPVSQRKEATEEQQKQKLSTLSSYVDGPYKQRALLRTSGRGQESVNMIKREFKSWLKLPLSQITPEMILQYRSTKLAEGIKQNTVRRNEQELRSLIKMAVTDDTINKDPLKSLPLARTAEGRIRYLIPAEEKRLRAALSARDVEGTKGRTKSHHGWPAPSDIAAPFTDHLTPAVLLSLNTGMRAGEMRTLQWSDVAHDLAMVSLRAATTKSRKSRHIPLNREARAVLQQLKLQSDTHCPYLFPNRDQSGPISAFGKRSWIALLEAAKITDFTWHGLRHSFASSLVMRRVPIIEVQSLLGHSDLRMTLKYAHLAPSALVDAVSALDDSKSHAVLDEGNDSEQVDDGPVGSSAAA